jgi:hypothetical protein
VGENARKDSEQYDIRVTVQAMEALYEDVAAGAKNRMTIDGSTYLSRQTG